MVKSTIKPEIEYNESKRIDAEDMDYETFVYEAEIFEKRVAICVGKIKYTHTGKGVIFYPVYLLSDGNVVRSQIGVFEMESKELPNYLDAENKLDAEIFAKDGNKILLYKFADKKFLEMSKSNPEFYKKVLVEEPRKIEVEEESVLSVLDLQQKHNSKIKEREKDENKEIFEEIGNAHIPDLLKEENKSDADTLKNPAANSNWMQKFMQNDNYRIQDVQPDGDCFLPLSWKHLNKLGKKQPLQGCERLLQTRRFPNCLSNMQCCTICTKTKLKPMKPTLEKYPKKLKNSNPDTAKP
jgi:hypothetical protein